jgi:hypothetical protein
MSFFLLQIVSTLITSLFLGIWVAVQWGVNYLIGLLQLSGIDSIVLSAFQVIFAVTTLYPIIVFYYVDARIIWIRARKTIIQEEQEIEVR